MMPFSLILAYLDTHLTAVRRRRQPDGERGAGDIVTMVIVVGLFAAAAIVICGILIAKAKTTANNVQTQ